MSGPTPSSPSRRSTLTHPSPSMVGGAVLLFYVLFALAALWRHGGDPLWFVWIGERFDQLDPEGRRGYDGQFAFYIAREGWSAIAHLDQPAYRMQRIAYPALVGGLSLGHLSVIPWVMIVVNLLAIALTTFLLAQWLSASGLSGWYALLYALSVGTLVALSRDLTEPLALAFVTAGVVLWLRKAHAAAVLPLALALLTKETTLLFVLGLAMATLMQRRARLWSYLALAALPLALWELFLWSQLGEIPLVSGPSISLLPLQGILSQLTTDPGRVSAFVFAGLLGVVGLALGSIRLWYERGRSSIGWWLLLNSLFVLLMPASSYDHIVHAGRNASGLVLSLVFVLPALGPRLRLAFLLSCLAPTALWLVPVLRWAPWLSEV